MSTAGFDRFSPVAGFLESTVISMRLPDADCCSVWPVPAVSGFTRYAGCQQDITITSSVFPVEKPEQSTAASIMKA